jgi:hypothetical protein
MLYGFFDRDDWVLSDDGIEGSDCGLSGPLATVFGLDKLEHGESRRSSAKIAHSNQAGQGFQLESTRPRSSEHQASYPAQAPSTRGQTVCGQIGSQQDAMPGPIAAEENLRFHDRNAPVVTGTGDSGLQRVEGSVVIKGRAI